MPHIRGKPAAAADGGMVVAMIADVRIYVVAAGLMWVGGFVDTLGFLLLGRLYLGNMSGDTVRVGVALARHDWPALLVRGTPILSFCVGLVIGGVVQDVARRLAVRRLLAAALLVEAVCLGLVAVLPPGTAGMRIFLGAAAMGIQNTSLRNSGLLPLYTTHVTGLLTELTEHLSALLAGVIGIVHTRGLAEPSRAAIEMSRRRHAAATGWLTLLYTLWVGGALMCATVIGWGSAALVLPLAVIIWAAAVDIVRPMTPGVRV